MTSALVFSTLIRLLGIYLLMIGLPDTWPLRRRLAVIVGVCCIALAAAVQGDFS